MCKKEMLFFSGQAETIATFKELLAKAEAGELTSAALRIFKADGTWEEVIIADTEEDRASAMASLRQMYKSAH